MNEANAVREAQEEKFGDREAFKRRIQNLQTIYENMDELLEETMEYLEENDEEITQEHLVQLLEKYDPPEALKVILPSDWREKLASILPESYEIPEELVDALKHIPAEHEEIDRLIDGIHNMRPSRFLMLGETGVGKSSLVNALAGEYVTWVTHKGERTTLNESIYSVESGEELFEIADARGIGDSSQDDELPAIEQLKKGVRELDPDAVIFVMDAQSEAWEDENLSRLKELQNTTLGTDIPVVVVRNKVDELDRAKNTNPDDWSQSTFERIRNKVQSTKEWVDEEGINYVDVIPTTSHIVWDPDPAPTEDDIPPNKRANHPPEEWDHVEVKTNHTYNIDHLADTLANNLELEAQIHFRLLRKIEDAVDFLCRRTTKAFTTAGAAVVVANPMPGDIFFLLPLEYLLVVIIAYIAGREVNFDSMGENWHLFTEVLSAMGAITLIGWVARQVFKQGTDLLPFGDQTVGWVLASSVIYSLGEASRLHFVHGETEGLWENVKGSFEQVRDYFSSKEEEVEPSDLKPADLPG